MATDRRARKRTGPAAATATGESRTVELGPVLKLPPAARVGLSSAFGEKCEPALLRHFGADCGFLAGPASDGLVAALLDKTASLPALLAPRAPLSLPLEKPSQRRRSDAVVLATGRVVQDRSALANAQALVLAHRLEQLRVEPAHRVRMRRQRVRRGRDHPEIRVAQTALENVLVAVTPAERLQ